MPMGIAEMGLPGRTRPARNPIDECRRDLLQIDGRPMPVRITGAVADAEQREALGVQLCRGSVKLAAGEHELRTMIGGETGFDIDRLVLTSDAKGKAADAPAPGGAPTADDDVDLRVVSSDQDSTTVDVDADKPFWLVLGQSHSEGWTASGLGKPTLVDGYANGWYVEPKGKGPMRITMRFTPQRDVDLALLLSALGGLLCLAIIALSWWRGRSLPAVERTDVRDPTWVWPWDPVGRRPRAAVVAAIALIGGVLAGVLVDPLVGAGIAAALALGLLLRRGPGILAIAAITSLGMASSFTIAKQLRNHYPPDFGWPGFFRPAHVLAWIGLLLIVASVAAGAARRRAAPPAASS